MSTRILTGVRWSSAVLCPRQAVYQGLGVVGAPPTPQQERVWRRGRFIGEAIAKDVAAVYADAGLEVIPEAEVLWPAKNPIGTGHADIYVPAEGEIIEVVSTKDAALPAHKALQVSGYVINHPEATRATVLSIDPSSSAERSDPVDVESFRPEVERIQGEVVEGLSVGRMPDRAGAHPGDFPCFWCAFKDTCWTGVEYPDPERIEQPDKVTVLQRLADLEDRISIGGKTVEHLKAERDELRAELRPWIRDGKDTVAGGIKVKVTPVAGPERFDLSGARKAGHVLPESLRPFITTGKGYDRWTLKRLQP
jgi:hypothetical protein